MLKRVKHLPARTVSLFVSILALLIVTIFVSACQNAWETPQSESGATDMATATIHLTTATPDERRPDAPAYALPGDFAVGYRAFESVDETRRTLDVHAWYPARANTGATERATYKVVFKDTTWQPSSDPLVLGTALEDGVPNGDHGPYPLIVLSHSFTGSAAGYSSLAEHYSSHGFVVLAPEHDELFDESLSDLWKALIDRPADVTQTLDFAEELTGSRGALADMIDMERVAVVGHSYGGYTALAVAGARIDMNAFHERCQQIPEDHPSAFICGAILPNEDAMAIRTGVDPDSSDLWPSFGDRRVRAIVPMAGDAYLFDGEGLSDVKIPMMAMGGTADFGTPYDWGAQLAYEGAASDRKALVGLIGAEHMIFATPCKYQPWMKEHPAHGYFCFDPVWDIERAQDLIHHLSTAFLLDVLKDDPAARAAIAPQAVQFPGIEYETTIR